MLTRLAFLLSALSTMLAPGAAAAETAQSPPSEEPVRHATRLGLRGTFALEPQGDAGLPLGWGVYAEHLVWRGLSVDLAYNSLHVTGNESNYADYRTLMAGSAYHPWPTATIDPWIGVGFGWWHSVVKPPFVAVPPGGFVGNTAAAGATIGATAAFRHFGVGLHHRFVQAFTSARDNVWWELGLQVEARF